MVGPYGSGKTTILTKLNFGELVKSVYSIGINVETVENELLAIKSWDIGGDHSKIRRSENHHYQNT